MSWLKKTLAAVCCLSILLIPACSDKGGDTQSKSASSKSNGTSSSSKSNGTSSSSKGTVATGKILDTDVWEAVPFVSKKLRDLGFAGGEGCQACVTIVYDNEDGQTAYFGTDVGGIYKSVDGGKTWNPCNFGMSACGANCIMVDPNNKDRVLLVGCNSGYCSSNNIYLTEDGEQWKCVFKCNTDQFKGMIGIHNDRRRQIAWDISSYDEKIGGSKVVYWSREDYSSGSKAGTYNHPAIYKSEDGGKSWKELAGTEDIAGGEIVVDAKNSNVIASSDKGIFLSTDGGKTWTKTFDKNIECLNNVYTKAGYAWACTLDTIYQSKDAGKTWSEYATFVASKEDITSFAVSPADTSRMMMTIIDSNKSFSYRLLVTHDSGKTWFKASRDASVGDIMPKNSWDSIMTWHPKNKDIAMSNGPYISTDGGKTFNYSKTGFNGICTGGYLAVNVNDNSLMSLGSQDFNGGYSTDSGYTWTYVNWAQLGWGGFCYGSYSLTKDIVVSTKRSSWNSKGELVYTKDGGKTVSSTGLTVTGKCIGYGVVGKENICFMAEYRTDDYCTTWKKMEGCTGVFEHDPDTGRLFGVGDYSIVYSDDDGVTWTKLCVVSGDVSDIAYNKDTKTLYYATSEGICSIAVGGGAKIGKVISGSPTQAKGVCVDPENNNIMYATRSYQGGNYDYDSVFRSLDGGKTWTCLNRHAGDGRKGVGGGRCASSIVFNEKTREVFVTSGCMGVWKIKAAPADTTN